MNALRSICLLSGLWPSLLDERARSWEATARCDEGGVTITAEQRVKTGAKHVSAEHTSVTWSYVCRLSAMVRMMSSASPSSIRFARRRRHSWCATSNPCIGLVARLFLKSCGRSQDRIQGEARPYEIPLGRVYSSPFSAIPRSYSRWFVTPSCTLFRRQMQSHFLESSRHWGPRYTEQ